MSKKDQTRIYIHIQEVYSCGDCPEAGSSEPGPDGVHINHKCAHPDVSCCSEKPLPKGMPLYEGIPKWCPLDRRDDVSVKIKTKKKQQQQQQRKEWYNVGR